MIKNLTFKAMKWTKRPFAYWLFPILACSNIHAGFTRSTEHLFPVINDINEGSLTGAARLKDAAIAPAPLHPIFPDTNGKYDDDTSFSGQLRWMGLNPLFRPKPLLDTIPPTITFEDVENVFSENYFSGFVVTNEKEKIYATISCDFKFPEEYYRFPEPIIKDDFSDGVVDTIVYDTIEGLSVKRTWKVWDHAGNTSTFEFVIAFDGAPYFVSIDTMDILLNDSAISLSDFFFEPICLKQELRLHASATNSCSDGLDYYWHLDNDDIPDKMGKSIVHSWNEAGTFALRLEVRGQIFNGLGERGGEILVKGPVFVVKEEDVSCAGLNDGALEIFPGENVSRFEWGDGSTDTHLTDLSGGEYRVTVWDTGECYILEEFTLIEPDSLDASLSKSDVTCLSGEDGSVKVAGISGGTPPYSLVWLDSNSGDEIGSSEEVNNVAAGTYEAQITDSNSCLVTKSITLPPGDPKPDAGFTMENDTLDLTYENEAVFTNTSRGASRYLWTFGDNETLLSASNIVAHEYKEKGTYTIGLLAMTDKGCQDSVSSMLTVIKSIIDSVPIDDQVDFFHIYPNPVKSRFSFGNRSPDIRIKRMLILNSVGQPIHEMNIVHSKSEMPEIEVDQLPQGVFIVIFITENNDQILRRLVRRD